jgi:hypothetical protein
VAVVLVTETVRMSNVVVGMHGNFGIVIASEVPPAIAVETHCLVGGAAWAAIGRRAASTKAATA